MVKVLFVYHNELEEGFMPASLAVLGGVAREAGAESRLFDTSFWRDKDSELIENNRQVRERTGEFKRVEGYNPEREIVDIKKRFMQVVEDYRPDLIAATSTSYEFNSLLDFMLPAKKRFNIPTIVGGSHPTVDPERSIQKTGVDMLCIGEGEKALFELLKRMEHGKDPSDIPNLWVKRENGEIIRNNLGAQIQMDDIPEPNWDIFDERHRIRPFEGELKSYGFFEISRGCPHSCSYCINDKMHKLYKEANIDSKVFRFHSPEEIVRRISKFKDKYNFNHIQFIDENLSVMPIKDLEKLATLYQQQVGVGFFAMARPEPIAANPKKADLLKQMGCSMVALGAESGNYWLRNTILNRPMKEGVLEAAAKELQSRGIMVSIYNIIGFPEETRSMIFDTIKLNRRIQPERFSVRFLNPYPGTQIRDYCVEKRYLEQNYEDLRATKSFLIEPVLKLPSPPHPTKQELMDLKQNFGRYIRMSNEEFNEVMKQESAGIKPQPYL